MAWVCAIRRKEHGKGEERLYFRDDQKPNPSAAGINQFLQELFGVERATGISLRSVDEAELPKLILLGALRGVRFYLEATL